MSRRDQVLKELAERCEKVGWKVRSIGTAQSHLLVIPPGKRPITIATGSSMRSYPERILSRLTKAGLVEAETRMGLDTEQRRQERLAEDRRKADDKLQAAEVAALAAPPPPAPPPAPTPPPAPAPPAPPVPSPAVVAAAIGRPAPADPGRPPLPRDLLALVAAPIAEWAYARTPIGATDRKCLELLLDNGCVVYACDVGDFVGPNWQSVSKHRKATHSTAAAATPPEAPRARGGTLVFKPGTAGGADAEDNYDRLSALLTVRQAQGGPRIPEPRTTPQPARTAAPTPARPRIVTAVPTPITAPAPAAPVTSGAAPDLAALVAKLRQLAAVDAERDRLELQNAQLRKQIEHAKAQVGELADQCIAKDREIQRLRDKMAADAATVEAAAELQKLMSALIATPSTRAA